MKKIAMITLLMFLLAFWTGAKTETKIYKTVDISEKKIALTFDDGPHPVQTPQILDILEKYDVKATFFVVGKNAEAYPEILKQTASYGHEIGNHTYSHPKMDKLSKKNTLSELEKCYESIINLCDSDVSFFRPPGGSVTPDIMDAAEKFGYKIILWNIDTKDWAHTSPLKIEENILKNIRNGSIILFHDYISKNSPTINALENIIPKLKNEGYSFVTVGELIDAEKLTTGKK